MGEEARSGKLIKNPVLRPQAGIFPSKTLIFSKM